MKVAIVYDYIPQWGGGAERTLMELVRHFAPNTHFYAAFKVKSPYSDKFIKELETYIPKKNIHIGATVSFIKQIFFRIQNFLLPATLQTFDLKEYDLVLSYTAFLSHSINPPRSGNHILYMNTPARFLWNLDQAYSLLKDITSIFLIADAMRYRSRLYDLDAINHVPNILTISKATKKRIQSFYNRDADILYPASVLDSIYESDFTNEAITKEFGTYFTHVSRIESYKNISLLIDTVSQEELKESVIIGGDGPFKKNLIKYAEKMIGQKAVKYYSESLKTNCLKISNIYFTEYIEEDMKFPLYANASASFELNDEDFGITKVESLAVGTPVIALAAGASPEVVIDGETGVLFNEDAPKSLFSAISKHKKMKYDKKEIIEFAKKFSYSAFHNNLDEYIRERIR